MRRSRRRALDQGPILRKADMIAERRSMVRRSGHTIEPEGIRNEA
jgi:hypothetical protein